MSLGHALAQRRPDAWVISVRAPEPSDFRQGWQWFSVHGVTDANRPERVALAMPRFLQRVAEWQAHCSVPPECTTLIGFSQGAIMALESTQQPDPPPPGRAIAIAGRFAKQLQRTPSPTALNLMHGEQDPVMPVNLAVEAEHALQALGAVATLDRFEGLGHGIDGRVVDAIVRRLGENRACSEDSIAENGIGPVQPGSAKHP